ncbi:MAG: HEAT repeat domain-containing protein [Anaerolineales bacterium]|nr:HEAT repeat domain-containing protein [Anaerolineales bacterium]
MSFNLMPYPRKSTPYANASSILYHTSSATATPESDVWNASPLPTRPTLEDDTDRLVHSLNDESWKVRRTAAEALGETRDPQAVEPLIGVLKDKDWNVRESAAEALAKIGTPAVGPLIDALKDEDAWVRWGAAAHWENGRLSSS